MYHYPSDQQDQTSVNIKTTKILERPLEGYEGSQYSQLVSYWWIILKVLPYAHGVQTGEIGDRFPWSSSARGPVFRHKVAVSQHRLDPCPCLSLGH